MGMYHQSKTLIRFTPGAWIHAAAIPRPRQLVILGASARIVDSDTNLTVPARRCYGPYGVNLLRKPSVCFGHNADVTRVDMTPSGGSGEFSCQPPHAKMSKFQKSQKLANREKCRRSAEANHNTKFLTVSPH